MYGKVDKRSNNTGCKKEKGAMNKINKETQFPAKVTRNKTDEDKKDMP